MDLISKDSSFGNIEITDTDLIKGLIDLLFSHTTTTTAEADLRVKTINEIKELVKPCIKK